MIVAPFIKLDEARRVTGLLESASSRSTPSVTVLTDFRTDSIVTSALDVEALCLLARSSERTEIVSVPRLHAKVYISDSRAAVVTSGNLTMGGLESNLEYGVQLKDISLVQKVRYDMNAFARLGSPVSLPVLEELVPVEQNLRADFAELLRSAESGG